MEVSNTTAVTLTVDPSIVLATRDYVDTRLDEHEHSTNHPDATLTQKGFTQLSNATDSDDETKAATPKAVKAAMAEARNHTHTEPDYRRSGRYADAKGDCCLTVRRTAPAQRKRQRRAR